MRENHLKQREEIALGRERDADARQLGELAVAQRTLLPCGVGGDETDCMPECPAEQRVHGGTRGIGGEVAREQIDREFSGGRGFTGIAQANDRDDASQFGNPPHVVCGTGDEPAIEQQNSRSTMVEVSDGRQRRDATHFDHIVA